MRKNTVIIRLGRLALAIVLFCSALITCACERISDPLPADPTPTDAPQKYVYRVTPTDRQYACIEPENDAAFLVLANKQFPVSESYQCPDLVTLDTQKTNGGKKIELNATAATALYAMLDEMAAYGIKDVCVTSAYRSYAYQNTLFNYYVENELARHTGWTREQAIELVLTYSAAPGTSEHQTGLCVDLWAGGMKELENYGYEGSYPDDTGFAETDACRWLSDNAHAFGFILRYPQGKEDLTGYTWESWHFRFVGRAVATEIYERGITFEEYLQK